MIDHDRLFKELLTAFFADFIALFFPDVAAYLDTSTITFLDKELFSDLPGAERRAADIVAQAQFRGAPAFFLIHCRASIAARAKFQPPHVPLFCAAV